MNRKCLMLITHTHTQTPFTKAIKLCGKTLNFYPTFSMWVPRIKKNGGNGVNMLSPLIILCVYNVSPTSYEIFFCEFYYGKATKGVYVWVTLYKNGI